MRHEIVPKLWWIWGFLEWLIIICLASLDDNIFIFPVKNLVLLLFIFWCKHCVFSLPLMWQCVFFITAKDMFLWYELVQASLVGEEEDVKGREWSINKECLSEPVVYTWIRLIVMLIILLAKAIASSRGFSSDSCWLCACVTELCGCTSSTRCLSSLRLSAVMQVLAPWQ